MDQRFCLSLLYEFKNIMELNKERLIKLDSEVGDGDLGLTMSDGFRAGYQHALLFDQVDLGTLFYQAGKAMSTAVPSTMGTLMASGLMNAGKVLKGKTSLTLTELVCFFHAYEEGVTNRGKANIGEKTFLDGLHPAIVAMDEYLNCGNELEAMAELAWQAAVKGYAATQSMIACHGRAAIRGEDSIGLKDPGAYVAQLMMEALLIAAKKEPK